MGLFSKHKDKSEKAEKSRPDLLNANSTGPPPPSSSPAPPQNLHNNSYHDSAYYSSAASNVSEEPKQQPQATLGQPPGTTVITTTTTTTTTTTVTSDGRTYTSSQPYNPETDPPVKSQELTIDDKSAASTSTLSAPTNPTSSTNIPLANNANQTTVQTTPQPPASTTPRPQLQRKQSPARKPVSQGFDSNSHLNLIPPTPPVTSGGRAIPPRSELRVSASPNRGELGTNDIAPGNSDPSADFLNNGPASPGPPVRSEKRRSIDRGLNVAPLKTNHSPSNSGGTPTSANSYNNQQFPPSHASPGTPSTSTIGLNNQQLPSYQAPPGVPPKDAYPASPDNNLVDNRHNQGYPENHHPAYTPQAGNSEPFSTGADSVPRTQTPNYSRPGPTVIPNSPSFAPPPSDSSSQLDAPPTSASAMHEPQPQLSHRQSITSALKGFQGASEALRGSINSGIARGTRDKAEQERQRAIKEQGLAAYKASGLQDRVQNQRESFREKAEERRRLRKRSLSRDVHGREGPGGLEVVEERSI